MSDLISRKSVLALAKDVTLEGGAKHRCIDASQIHELPSAQQWIPCSERLPEECGDFLVTRAEYGWNCEYYEILDIAFYDGERWHKTNKVIAWMPLPEPYEDKHISGKEKE